MKIQDNYEKTQVLAGCRAIETTLFDTKSQKFTVAFGGSGSQELLEAHNIFDRLLNEASKKLKVIEDMI